MGSKPNQFSKALHGEPEQRVDPSGLPCLVQHVEYHSAPMILKAKLFDGDWLFLDPSDYPRLRIGLMTGRLTPPQWDDVYVAAEEEAEDYFRSLTYKQFCARKEAHSAKAHS